MNLKAPSLPFVHILNLSKVYGRDRHGPKIAFETVDEGFLEANKGIHLIVQGAEQKVIFCGMCGTESFRDRLLFNKPDDLHFHHQDRIRELVGSALSLGHSIAVYAQSEDQLRRSLIDKGSSPEALGSLMAIRNYLIKLYEPVWNRRA